MKRAKGLRLRDLDPSYPKDGPICFYELLTDERFDKYTEIRMAARTMNAAVWQSGGIFYARKVNSTTSRRIKRVSDLNHLVD